MDENSSGPGAEDLGFISHQDVPAQEVPNPGMDENSSEPGAEDLGFINNQDVPAQEVPYPGMDENSSGPGAEDLGFINNQDVPSQEVPYPGMDENSSEPGAEDLGFINNQDVPAQEVPYPGMDENSSGPGAEDLGFINNQDVPSQEVPYPELTEEDGNKCACKNSNLATPRLSIAKKLDIVGNSPLKNNAPKPDSTVTFDNKLPNSYIASSSKDSNKVEERINTPALPVTSAENLPMKPSQVKSVSTSVLFSNLTSSSVTNSVDAGPENDFASKTEIKKKAACAEPVHLASSAANSSATSSLFPARYKEISGQKCKIILKHNGQSSVSPDKSSLTGLILPLNSSKDKIKFLARHSGAVLSLRPTANPNVHKIVGPKITRNSPSNNQQISSPDITSTSDESASEYIKSSQDVFKKEGFSKPSSEHLSYDTSNKFSENDKTSVFSKKSAADTTEPDDSEADKQTADSAITTSLKYISNNSESFSAVADSSIIDIQPLCYDNAETDSKLKSDFLTVNSDTGVDNCVGIESEDLCTVENGVILASNIEVEISSDNNRTSVVTENNNDLLEHSVTVDSAHTVKYNELIDSGDADTLDSKLDISLPKFRPLSENSVGIADSTENEDDKVVVEDSELEEIFRMCFEIETELFLKKAAEPIINLGELSAGPSESFDFILHNEQSQPGGSFMQESSLLEHDNSHAQGLKRSLDNECENKKKRLKTFEPIINLGELSAGPSESFDFILHNEPSQPGGSFMQESSLLEHDNSHAQALPEEFNELPKERLLKCTEFMDINLDQLLQFVYFETGEFLDLSELDMYDTSELQPCEVNENVMNR